MRSRAALLPFPGDPFLLQYWLRQFDTVWGDEVDALYILHNSPCESSVREFIHQECKKRPKVKLLDMFFQIEHGRAIDLMLNECQETHVMLIEDDCFIFRKGVVDAAFEAIESNKKLIIGSKRGSCSQEILDRAKQIWGLDYHGLGDQGPNFWPNLFFTTRDTLLATDRNFGARAWHKGQEVHYLSTGTDIYFAQGDPACGDTFVNTSLQLRATYPEDLFYYIPQYHGSPDDIEHYEKRICLFDGKSPWVHVGSLSSGIGGVLMDDKGRSLIRRLSEPEKGDTVVPSGWCQSEGEKHEWERRCQWWMTFYQQRDPDELKDFAELYRLAIERVINTYRLSWKQIRRRQEMYRELGLP